MTDEYPLPGEKYPVARTGNILHSPLSLATVAAADLVIPVTASFVSKTTGGAEALTIADGTPEQVITITLAVSGGIGTITPATASGFTSVDLVDAGDSVTMRFVDATIGWVIVGGSGILQALVSATVAAADLVIPRTANYVAKTTGGVEALTLADGVAGQVMTIALVATGGAGTLTPDTASGFSTVVLEDAGDNVTLRFIDTTIGWVVVGAAGVAAPPVISA